MSATIGQNPMGVGQVLTLKGQDPSGKAKSARAVVSLSAAHGAQVVNFTAQGSQALGQLATVYVDNSAGPVPVSVTFPDTGLSFDVPAWQQGYFPALTTGQILTVAAPLVAVLDHPFPVSVIGLSFQVPQQAYGPFLPNQNAGVAYAVGTSAGWQVWDGAAPDGASSAPMLYSALEVDCTKIAARIEISGTAVDGSAWTITQLPLVKSEFVIPATASGSAIVATAAIPLGGNTTATVPTRWRVQPCGESPAYGVPLYMPWSNVIESSMPSGASTVTIFPADPDGAFLDMLMVTAQGWSASFNLNLYDSGLGAAPGQLIWTGSFPNGNVSAQVNLGYVSYARNAAINLVINNAAAATGALTIGVRGSIIDASQNG